MRRERLKHGLCDVDDEKVQRSVVEPWVWELLISDLENGKVFLNPETCGSRTEP